MRVVNCLSRVIICSNISPGLGQWSILGLGSSWHRNIACNKMWTYSGHTQSCPFWVLSEQDADQVREDTWEYLLVGPTKNRANTKHSRHGKSVPDKLGGYVRWITFAKLWSQLVFIDNHKPNRRQSGQSPTIWWVTATKWSRQLCFLHWCISQIKVKDFGIYLFEYFI